MSVLLNFGAPPEQAASTTLKIMIDQKRAEEEGEIGDREAEGFLRYRIAVGEVDAKRIGNEQRAENERGEQINDAAHAYDIGQQARAEKNERVQQHLQTRVVLAVRDRQHWHAGPGIVLRAVEGERPEMRRRPGEDDEEENHRLCRDLAGDRRPAENRWHGARGAADDDVLRRGGLQQQR